MVIASFVLAESLEFPGIKIAHRKQQSSQQPPE
jgi:hypothetical protein